MQGRILSRRRAHAMQMAFGAVVASLAIAGASNAGTLRWVNPSGGVFGAGPNWDAGVAPLATDDVIFDLATAYVVTGDAGARSLAVEAGDVQFDLSANPNGFQGWIIAGGAGQTASATLTGHVQSSGGVAIGAGAGATGSLVLSGAGAIFRYDDFVTVGRAGAPSSGTLRVEGGAALSDLGGIAQSTIHGDATITGAGSLFRARVADVNGRMAFEDGAVASVESWNVLGELRVADSRINVEIDFQAAAGSRIEVARGRVLGSDADFSLTSATLAIHHASEIDALTFELTDSVVELGISAESILAGGPFVTAFTGDVSINTLRLSLLDGFIPTAGDSLHLMRIEETHTGLFTTPFSAVQLVGAWGSLTAQTQFIGRGEDGGFDAYVTFLPAPGSALALGVGLSVALRRRRPTR